LKMVHVGGSASKAVTRNVNNTDGSVDAKASARLYAQREQKFLTKVFNSAVSYHLSVKRSTTVYRCAANESN
jgi:hypothetical protein